MEGWGEERERDRNRGRESAVSAPVVLAADTRSAQRRVPAPLHGPAQPGGGTSLQPRGAAEHHLTAVSLFCFRGDGGGSQEWRGGGSAASVRTGM